MDEAAHSRDRLYMYLKKLHGGKDDMIRRLEVMMELLKKSEIVMERFYQSTNAGDFATFYNIYRSLSNKIRSEVDAVESEMVRLKVG